MSYLRNQLSITEGRRFLTDQERAFFTSIVEPLPHAVYGCFTFRNYIDESQADKAFRSLIEILSRRFRENIGWLRATEKRLSGCSSYGGTDLHYHFVLFSNAPLYAAGIEAYWSAEMGNAKCDPYDPTRNGLGYLFKSSHQDYCDWAFSDNLYIFRPGYQPKNRQRRRAIQRHGLRVAQHSTDACLSSPAAEPRIKNVVDSIGFRGRLTKATRLRCPAGCGLQAVAKRLKDSGVHLRCGHQRKELLPTHGISLEHIGTPIGDRFFPEDVLRAGR